MRLRTPILLLSLLLYGQVKGQLILTEEENLSWINKLRDETELSTRLEMIRARLLSDTSVYVRKIGERVGFKRGTNENKKDGLCRPILIVEGSIIDITNDTERQTIENLTKELTTKNVKQLEVVDGERAKALFGQNGWCGVVLITATNKKGKKTLLRHKI